MSAFSPSDVAFEGFRLTREKPKAVLAWAVASFVVSLLTVPLMISTGLGEFMNAPSSTDSAASLAMLEKAGPIALVVLILGLFIQAMFYTAVYRAVLSPQDKAFGYLRMGMDEVRQVALFLVLILILTAAVFVIVLLAAFAVGIAGGVLNASGPVGQGLAGLLALGVTIYVLGLVLYVAVRLSLALPMTFVERRLRVVSAWRLTKGYFWRMTGAYLLAIVLFVVVMLIASIIFYGVIAVIGAVQGVGLQEAVGQVEANLTSIRSYFTIPTLLGAMFGALVSAVYYSVTIAPSAVIYQALTREPDEGAEANLI